VLIINCVHLTEKDLVNVRLGCFGSLSHSTNAYLHAYVICPSPQRSSALNLSFIVSVCWLTPKEQSRPPGTSVLMTVKWIRVE